MSEREVFQTWRHQVRWLPSLDWNVKFYGGHERQVAADWTMPMETHVGFELNLILAGEQETTMEGSRYLLRAGDMLLIPPGFRHAHRCVSAEGLHYFCVHFNVDDPEFRQRMLRLEQRLLRAESEESLAIRALIEPWLAMLRDEQPPSTGERFRIQIQLFELLARLATLAVPPEDEAAGDDASASYVRYARAIAEVIKRHFDPHERVDLDGQPALRIEQIAASLGISPGYALEAFRKLYGMSPRQYLSDLKMREAKALLQQSHLGLKEIAARLGYAELSHFSRQFKRWTGLSPQHYRQTHR